MHVIPLPNCSPTQTSIILPVGVSETNTHNFYYFHNGKKKSLFFHAALTQSQPKIFCSSFQTIMPSQKMSTDHIFECHSQTWKPVSMLQGNGLCSYAITWVVPDHPNTSRLSSTEIKTEQPLGFPGALNWDGQVPQLWIQIFGAANSLLEVPTCLLCLKMKPKAPVLLMWVPDLSA